ncbi:MAG: sigma 54-interacting transcriptional regulator [Polyangiaceae bacterium]
MTGISHTTERDERSVELVARARLWLRWASNTDLPAIKVEQGLTLGRDKGCAVTLSGKGVSRRHAELYRQGPIFVVKDLGSTNGTYVDGKRVQHGAIGPGTVLRLGEHVGVFAEYVNEPHGLLQLATGLLGGPELAAILSPLRNAAKSRLAVVLVGATGTGKERVARAVHEYSGRSGRFQAINCAALPKEMAEAELFGHRKGAFTSADRAGLGHFRAADRGTLFLDEVADLSLAAQAKLLRVLEERSVTPLGETEPVSIDVRVVVATQKPLETLVAARQFRADLHARLAGLTVTLTPLNARGVDAPLLFRHFITANAVNGQPQLDVKLLEAIALYDWPHNVRELEQVARQLLAVHSLEPILKRAFLPTAISKRSECCIVTDLEGEFPERRTHDLHRLARALEQTSGQVKAAAGLLGFSRQRAYRLLDGRPPADFVAQYRATADLIPLSAEL